MENFLSTFVFLLPGLMAYFWLQLFGLNPPIKHTAPEVSSIAALLWLPISYLTLVCLNLWAWLYNNPDSMFSVQKAWTIEEVKQVTSDVRYLALFLFVSAIVSFGVCALWGKWGVNLLEKAINIIREWREVAPLSKKPTVWDEIFSNNDSQVVEIRKLDKPEYKQIGGISKVSRPFEPERALVLDGIKIWTKLVEKYNPEPDQVFIDIKSGIVIKVFNLEEMLELYRVETMDKAPIITSRVF